MVRLERIVNPENETREIALSRQQVAGVVNSFVDHFFPEILTNHPAQYGRIRKIIKEALTKLTNPELCPEINLIELSLNHPFSSLAEKYQPENRLAHSIIGCGSTGLEAARVLQQLEAEFDIYLLNKIPDQNSRKFRKLPLELQLLILNGDGNQETRQQLSSFLENGGVFLFAKRKKIPPEMIDIIYQLSLLTGRRLDWLESWIIDKGNGDSFRIEKFFGEQPPEKKREIKKLINQLTQFSPTFFQLIPIDVNGQVDNDLEKKINDPFQDLENLYAQMLLTSADWEEELKTTRMAFLLSIPSLFLVNHFLENNPVLARAIPPALADILTLWAEGSPFLDRTLPMKEKICQFTKLISQKYKASVIATLVLSYSGSQFVDWLNQIQMLIEAGFAYAFVPFVGALITTFQSFLQEYQKGKELRKLRVNGFSDLNSFQLIKESLLNTVKHPARLYLLLAGLLGVGEGAIIGALNLLDNPLALTYVGELNESVLTTIGLFLHNQIVWQEYQKKLKEKINSIVVPQKESF